MGTLLATFGVLFALMSGAILVDRIYRRFATRNPELGPFRETDKCGSCCAGSGCSDKKGCA